MTSGSSYGLSTRLLSYRSSIGFKIIVVSFAIFTDVLFYGLIIPFVPTMLRTRIHMTLKQEQLWNSILLAIYGGSTLIASPICGWIADRKSSRRGPLLVGLCCLGAATLVLHLGRTLQTLILGRIFQGASAAMVYSAGLALLCDAVGRESLGQVMGYVTLSITAATFVGPTLGGILFDAGGERAVFGFAYAVIAVDITLRLAVVEGKAEPKPRLVDSENGRQYDGSASESAPLIREASPNAGDPHVTADNKGSSFLALLRNPRILAALTGWMAVGAFLSSFDAVLPIFMHDQFGWSPTGVGLIFLPLMIPNLAGPLYGRLVDSSPQGSRLFGALGFLMIVPPLILLRLVQADVRSVTWLLCSLLFFIGIGLGIAGPALMLEVFSAVSDMEAEDPGAKGIMAQAYGLYNSAMAVGQLLGPLAAGPMLSFFGWQSLTTAFGVFSGLCGLLMSMFLGGFIRPTAIREYLSNYGS